MTFNSIMLLILAIMITITGISVTTLLFKNRKRSAESIYKLIDDLEKKYIY